MKSACSIVNQKEDYKYLLLANCKVKVWISSEVEVPMSARYNEPQSEYGS